jgi:hypothetical protein
VTPAEHLDFLRQLRDLACTAVETQQRLSCYDEV